MENPRNSRKFHATRYVSFSLRVSIKMRPGACTAFHTKISFVFTHVNETHSHMKCFAPGRRLEKEAEDISEMAY